MSAAVKTDWYMTGEEVVTCNCAWGCPCQFNALPTRGYCEGWLTCRIDKGHYGEVKLDAVKFAAMLWFPGAVHEGNGTLQPVIDSATSIQQRAALTSILSGTEGGSIFEILSAICSKVLDTIYAPISFTSNREARTASVEIPGIARSTVEPIKNPVTGEEHRAKIVLPNGFEYTEAEMGNAVQFQVKVGSDWRMDYTNSYSQLNRFEWKNT
jgi:hypothetical protein